MRRFDRRWSSSSVFQCSPGLNEQATVNRFVGHAQALAIGILVLQPPGNLLRRPVQDQSTRNDVPQLAVLGKQTSLRTQGRNPSLLICILGTIGRTATMASYLPAHGGGRSIQASRYLTNRGTRSDPSRDVLSLATVSATGERRRSAGGIPPRGNNTARMQLCGLCKARPISCSDCPVFQRLQTSRFSIAESPNLIPRLMPTPPLQRRLTLDGVASTYRMRRIYRRSEVLLHMDGNATNRELRFPCTSPPPTMYDFALEEDMSEPAHERR